MLKIRVSALAAAELPDTITASKELTPTCTNRLAMAKMAFCKPVGMPMASTRRPACMWNRSFRHSRRHSSCRRTRCSTISRADSHWAITLAVATPSAAMWQRITKNRFSITFSTPDSDRYSRGRFVSPVALSTPLPKLYSAMAGMPKAYIFKYRVAPSISSSLVFSRASMGRASRLQISSMMMPAAAQMRKEV